MGVSNKLLYMEHAALREELHVSAAAVSSLWNASVVWGLVEGRYSYNRNEEKWRKVLKETDDVSAA
jgi:hypothetical protein